MIWIKPETIQTKTTLMGKSRAESPAERETREGLGGQLIELIHMAVLRHWPVICLFRAAARFPGAPKLERRPGVAWLNGILAAEPASPVSRAGESVIFPECACRSSNRM